VADSRDVVLDVWIAIKEPVTVEKDVRASN